MQEAQQLVNAARRRLHEALAHEEECKDELDHIAQHPPSLPRGSRGVPPLKLAQQKLTAAESAVKDARIRLDAARKALEEAKAREHGNFSSAELASRR